MPTPMPAAASAVHADAVTRFPEAAGTRRLGDTAISRFGDSLGATGSAIDPIVPAMREMDEPELARAAAHDERPLDVVEYAQPFGIGGMRPDPVLARLQRQRGKRQRERSEEHTSELQS